jgi:uncharacterized membrane protein YvbJ
MTSCRTEKVDFSQKKETKTESPKKQLGRKSHQKNQETNKKKQTKNKKKQKKQIKTCIFLSFLFFFVSLVGVLFFLLLFSCFSLVLVF